MTEASETVITEKTRVSFEIYKVIAILASGFILACTVVGVYYDFKYSFQYFQQSMDVQIRTINARLDRLEKEQPAR